MTDNSSTSLASRASAHSSIQASFCRSAELQLCEFRFPYRLLSTLSFILLSFTVFASEPALIETNPDALSGGATTVFDESRNAFTFSARNLDPKHRTAFFVGNSFFNENWVAAPASTTARDGLGPLFNTRSCSACHFKDGRSAPPLNGGMLETMLLRLGIPARQRSGALADRRQSYAGQDQRLSAEPPLPEPTYGDQLQTRSLPNVPAEADALVHYEIIEGEFSDGEKFTLRRPTYVITNLAYGPIASNLLVSPRVAPAIIGLGLLEAIPEKTLRSLADAEDRNGDGISGRLNSVWDVMANRQNIGRFGWKAEQPSVLQQVAGALNGDMGLTTSLFPRENHTPAQQSLAAGASGGDPEVSDEILQAMVLYSRTLAVPARRNVDATAVRRGQQLFRQINCAACHVPELETGDLPEFPELSRQLIRPYTDLLLHDLGEPLSDNRPVAEASGREWRTPPLWGIGLVEKVNGHSNFLHDGRARNLTEAILWHGGEAEASRELFRRLTKSDRTALICFLESL